MMLTRFINRLPIINFIISFTALNFQFFVLYPWHKELSLEFIEIKKLISS